MDKFILDNVARYQALLKALKPVSASQTNQTTAGTGNPNMVVGARIRPLLEEEVSTGFPCAIFPSSATAGVVDIHDLYNHPRGRPILKSFNYEVDRLFDSQSTTEEIYQDLVTDLVPFAWNGGIGTLFAYGQTGSGKTFTVSRLEQLVAESLMSGTFEGQRNIHITIIDLAGNSAYDLLNSRAPISILEDAFGATQLAGAEEHQVHSRDEMIDLIEHAASFRRTAPTFKNDASSRSHGICRIRVTNPSTGSDGLLYLIDLAGSEAARDIAIHGADRMRETREINISLSVLKDCIRGKAQADALMLSDDPKSKQKKPHVPFRHSALTKVLKHVFDPASISDCKTVVIACVNPSLADVGPSKNTLRYAKTLRVPVPTGKNVVYNPVAPMTWSNTQLREWISKNSGAPPISPTILAPTESGAQFLHLSSTDIENRCRKSPGVSAEQAKAFASKIWRMHIDSQRNDDTSNTQIPNPGESTDSGTPIEATNRSSSKDLNPTNMGVPFKERIQPGMVISWKKTSGDGEEGSTPDGINLAVVLSPVSNTQATSGKANPGSQYICAVVTQGIMAEAYEINLWRQVVVDVESMEKEVVLEYDQSTRYYYISPSTFNITTTHLKLRPERKMLVSTLEKTGTMKSFDAKRAHFANINAKLAALDNEQISLEENLLKAEADRATLKQGFEDELKEWREFVEKKRATFVAPFQVVLVGIKLSLATNNDDENIRKAWEEKSKEQEQRVVTWSLELKEIGKKRMALFEEKQALLGMNTDDGSVGCGVKVGTSTEKKTCSSCESKDLPDFQMELSAAKDELDELAIRNANTETELQYFKAKYNQALSNHTAEKKALTENINMLNDKIQEQSLLIEPAIDIRLRFMECSKRRLGSSGIINKVRGEPDRAIIDKGTNAARCGNAMIDANMLTADSNRGKKYSEIFSEIYGFSYITVYQGRTGVFATGSKMLEIINLHGTMAHCLSFTKLSHNKVEDKNFLNLFEKCKNLYNNLKKSSKPDSEIVQALNNSQRVEVFCVTMRRNCADIVRAEKAGLRSQ
ncbi:kinesin motor domain-containing protein [Rutstroemia sp. NJR-2017a BVV2]|nr:kinesin motor domain-containing protein [Rutstroemia sp. NJR-2017a BVV2]